MVLFRVRMHLDDASRGTVVRSLIGTLEPTRAQPGCLNCHLSADMEDARTLIYTEEWQDQELLANRLGGDSLRVLLAAMDCTTGPPEIRFDTICGTKGIEWIVNCRKTTRQ